MPNQSLLPTQTSSGTPDLPQRVSPSRIYCLAAGREPSGLPLSNACQCVMCEAHLLPGALHVPITKDTFGESFNNKLDIKVRGLNTVVCGDCDALWNGEFMQKYSKSYANAGGMYKLASTEDIQAFLLSPPAAPFVAIFNTRKQQHMIWRTPVSYSNAFFFLRVDDTILTINRQRALDANRSYQLILRRMKAMGMKGVPTLLDAKLGDTRTAVFRQDVIMALEKEGGASLAAYKDVSTLTMGEWWAIAALRHVDMDKPESWPKPVKLEPGQNAQEDDLTSVTDEAE